MKLLQVLFLVSTAVWGIFAQDRGYSAINFYGQGNTNGLPHSNNRVTHPPNPAVELQPQPAAAQFYQTYGQQLNPAKVVIRPASTLTTENSAKVSTDRPIKDGCSCVPVDTCTIEEMDFSFAVPCKHGEVRCCSNSPDVRSTTPSWHALPSTSSPPATQLITTPKPIPHETCKCIFPNDCPKYAQRRGNCPLGLISCCHSADQNIGNAAGFQPVDLPFLKVPSSSNPAPSLETGFSPVASSSNLQPAVIRPEMGHFNSAPEPTPTTPITPLAQAIPLVSRPLQASPTYSWPVGQQQVAAPVYPANQYPQNYARPGIPQFSSVNPVYASRPSPDQYYQPNPYLGRPQQAQKPESTQSPNFLSSFLSLFS